MKVPFEWVPKTGETALAAYVTTIDARVGAIDELDMPRELRREKASLQHALIKKYGIELTACPEISVVIPTFNRCEILMQCLEHLCRQTLPTELFEVLVCDDGSMDQTAEIARSFDTRLRLFYLRQQNMGPASARNMGIGKASGEFILFLNDDALLDSRALEIHLAEHRRLANPKAAVLGLFSMHPAFTDPLKPVGYCLDQSRLIFDYNIMEPNTGYGFNKFYTCNISLRRDFLTSGELFDTAFLRMGAEDIELGYRLQQRGCEIYYRSDCRALHAHVLEAHGLGRMFIFRGKGGVSIFRRHNELPHHYRGMKPEDAERFRFNHLRFESSLNIFSEIVHRINCLEYVKKHDTPIVLEETSKLNFMMLWESSDQQIESAIEVLKNYLDSVFDELLRAPSRILEDAAIKLFPALNFIKWYYDTVGVVESALLPELMELNARVADKAVERTADPIRSAAPRQARILPCWQADGCLLDLIPYPLQEM